MTGVSYALVDYVSGGPILDLPVMAGASWASQLNRADALSCKVDENDPEVRALDLPSSTEPKKTIMIARTDDDVILAWGLIDTREWDEDERTLSLDATGVWSSYFGKTIIGPASALTAPLVVTGPDGFPVVNPALDTSLSGLSLGSIGKRLVAQRLAWPGAPVPFTLPVDEVSTNERVYPFSGLKSIGAALTDLAGVDNGPDFAFDAARASNGLSLEYRLRHGTASTPRIGTHVGSWSLDEMTPLTDFKITDSGDELGSTAWLTAGRSAGAALVSRATNAELVTLSGYPPMDLVDTTHGDVSVQATLNAYAAELIRYGGSLTRDLSFSVRADATPMLGQYRPGDTITIDVPDDHPYIRKSIDIRVTSISGNETGLDVKVGCVILDA